MNGYNNKNVVTAATVLNKITIPMNNYKQTNKDNPLAILYILLLISKTTTSLT